MKLTDLELRYKIALKVVDAAMLPYKLNPPIMNVKIYFNLICRRHDAILKINQIRYLRNIDPII